jgi:uncharacterized NAD-dependent epimerase/dehydratase family protein
MRPSPERRLVILAEGNFGFHHGKTAMGVLRYGRDSVVAVIDSTKAGENVREYLGDGPRFDVPIVGTLDEALALPHPPHALLIGIAPTGGRFPDTWRRIVLQAIEAGLDILSGLHTMLGDDPEFADAARRHGVRIVDYRRMPDREETARGRTPKPGTHTILTVGTDCAIGKMSVALELRQAADEAGLVGVFVPTGQTGMMIEGWGVAVDRVISDFLNGTCEWLVEQAETLGDWIFIEGQGSIDHAAYSSVTLGLIHGCTPDAMVLVHKPGLEYHDFDHRPDVRYPLMPLPMAIEIHERIAALVRPSKVVAVALNTSLIANDEDARRVVAETAELTGLPTDDPFRFGGGRLFAAIRERLEAGVAA